MINEVEEQLEDIFKQIDIQAFKNSCKVLDAFNKYEVSENDFNTTSGYGYNDYGRDKIEKIFAYILGAEDALVRSQFVSGTHALSITFNALLRPNEQLLSISGLPYDTLHEVIGIKPNNSSLKSYNVKYSQIDLINDDFDYEKIEKYLEENTVKVIEIQRSKGYSLRKSLGIEKLAKVIKLIKDISPQSIVMVDNCYCEFVEDKTPLEVGADVIVGSLIKNLGAGIATNGAYIAGKKNIIDYCAQALNVAGEGREVGPSNYANKMFLQGLYMAPSAVASSLKTAIFTSLMCEKLNIEVEPKYNDKRVDIVQSIIFNDEDLLIKYVQGIQSASAIDSNAVILPVNTPGYKDKIIMASGSFVQGSSIEISCDGPLRKPYVAYQQGSLTYEYGKLAVINALKNINKDLNYDKVKFNRKGKVNE